MKIFKKSKGTGMNNVKCLNQMSQYSRPSDLIGRPIYNHHKEEGSLSIYSPLDEIIIPLELKDNGKVLIIECNLDIGFDKECFLEEIENQAEYLPVDNYLFDAIEAQERTGLKFRWNKVEEYLDMYTKAVSYALRYFSSQK